MNRFVLGDLVRVARSADPDPTHPNWRDTNKGKRTVRSDLDSEADDGSSDDFFKHINPYYNSLSIIHASSLAPNSGQRVSSTMELEIVQMDCFIC